MRLITYQSGFGPRFIHARHQFAKNVTHLQSRFEMHAPVGPTPIRRYNFGPRSAHSIDGNRLTEPLGLACGDVSGWGAAVRWEGAAGFPEPIRNWESEELLCSAECGTEKLPTGALGVVPV